ncbi:MAG: hypothetical protein KatS3mg131_3919 [Candidatus Tectimicrobiota bacterium]|nr:MAG: hypothetical protein KatS3mg131_3919 [Candidatus Tectomicrobia bacterium]
MRGWAVAWGVAAWGIPQAAWACAVCWGGDDPLAQGLRAGIVFLMAMPFALGSAFAGILFVAHRRARRQPTARHQG